MTRWYLLQPGDYLTTAHPGHGWVSTKTCTDGANALTICRPDRSLAAVNQRLSSRIGRPIAVFAALLAVVMQMACGDINSIIPNRTMPMTCTQPVLDSCQDQYDVRYGIGTIISAEVFAGLTRFETASPHGLSIMQFVRVTGTDHYDGEYHVKAHGFDTTHFTVSKTFVSSDEGIFHANELGPDYVRISDDVDDDTSAYKIQYIDIREGQAYEINALIQASLGWDSDVVTIGVDWYSSDGVWLATSTIYDSAFTYSHKWLHMSGTVAAPKGSFYATAFVHKSSGEDHPFDLYVDYLNLRTQGCSE